MKKQRTLAQKKKRPTSHRVGKRIDFPKENQRKKNPKPPFDPFESSPSIVKKEGTLKANKKYKRLKIQFVVGNLLGIIPVAYIVLFLGYVIAKTFYFVILSYLAFLQFMVSNGIYRPDIIRPTLWQMITAFTYGHPIIMYLACVTLFFGYCIKQNAVNQAEKMKGEGDD